MVTSYNFAKVTHPEYGITRRILAHSNNIMLTEHLLEKGAVLPDHNHPHEQLVYLLKGEISLELGGQKLNLVTGDSLVIPSGDNHKVIALTKSTVLDIFSPARQDYL
jgi:quercetin dioxygenase-like cupin family protein